MKKYSPKVSAAILCAIGALAVAVMALAPAGCRTTQPLADDVTNIAADCGKPAVRDIALHILDDVTSALVTADYSGGIRAIVTGLISGVAESAKERALSNAWEAAACSVEEIHRRTGVSLGYGRMDEATTERQAMIRAHATAWLAGHR